MLSSFSQVKKNLIDNVDVQNSLLIDQDAKMHLGRNLQHMFAVKLQDAEQQKIYELILSSATEIEKLLPGFGTIFIKKFCGCQTNASPRLETRSDLVNYFTEKKFSNLAIKVLLQILAMSSKSTKVFLKKSTSQHFHIEKKYGYVFPLSALIKFHPVELNNPKILCIDGYIESVAEIHHLLEAGAESKIPVVLVCRGAADDVLSTIKTNLDRKTLLLYPFKTPFELDCINDIVDIATAAGGDVVSSLKGQLISSIKFENLASVERCEVRPASISISNANSADRVKQHIAHLKKSMQENDNLVELYTKRLEHLTASQIIVSLPDGLEQQVIKQQVDEGIRTITALMNGQNFSEQFLESKIERLHQVLSDIGYFVA